MNPERITPTGREAHFAEDEIIVSKTDLRGIITYANDVFLRVAGYTEAEVLGQPHNLIRHPDMPRCVFKLLWDTIQSGQEIFAYVLNMAKDGGHYWVFAHVTPSYDLSGRHVGYHSNRRVPFPDALTKVRPLYAQLLAAEQQANTPKLGMAASGAMLLKLLKEQNQDYSEFVFNLSEHTRLEAAAK
jgi:PAS domain S-box-containing protein